MTDIHWHFAKHKKYETKVVFVHHFGGNYKTPRRHIKMMNSLGFDCVSFTMSCHFDKFTVKDYISVSYKGLVSRGGIVGRWADEIDRFVTTIEGPILIYSFSSPSLAVPFVIQKHSGDIKAWICDGGPFFSLHKGFSRYYKRIHNMHNPFVLNFFRFVAHFVWRNFSLRKKTIGYLKKMPANFPILSIRGKNDLLVLPTDIDLVFNPVENHLNITRFLLEEGGHLDGLARHSKDYKAFVSRFLEAQANSIGLH